MQSGCTGVKAVEFGKSGGFGQKVFYWGKVGCIREKMHVYL